MADVNVIKLDRLLKLLRKSDIVSFRKWYIKMLDYKYSRKLLQEDEKFWSNSIPEILYFEGSTGAILFNLAESYSNELALTQPTEK